jgi:hypothetical protein
MFCSGTKRRCFVLFSTNFGPPYVYVKFPEHSVLDHSTSCVQAGPRCLGRVGIPYRRDLGVVRSGAEDPKSAPVVAQILQSCTASPQRDRSLYMYRHSCFLQQVLKATRAFVDQRLRRLGGMTAHRIRRWRARARPIFVARSPTIPPFHRRRPLFTPWTSGSFESDDGRLVVSSSRSR